MGRRATQTPRLNTINPQTLGLDAQQKAEGHMRYLDSRIGGPDAGSYRDGPPLLEIAVSQTVQYAQGKILRDDLMNPIRDHLRRIRDVLWARMIDGEARPDFDLAFDVDLDDLKIDLVGQLMVASIAALGREAMESRPGRSLSVQQLAALASVSPDYLRMLAREGTLDLSDGHDPFTCTAANARKFLKSRGVPVYNYFS